MITDTPLNIVEAILKAPIEGDFQPLVDLLFLIDPGASYEDINAILRPLTFVLCSMWGGMTPEAKQNFRANLTNAIVNEEIQEMFWTEEDDD